MRILLILFALPYLIQAQDHMILTVTSATIYEQGTTINRTGTLNLTNGLNKITIDELPIDMNETTLSVLISGKSYILTKQITREYTEPPTPSGKYNGEKQRIQDSIHLVQTFNEILVGESNILKENSSLSNSDNGFTAAQVSALRSNYSKEMKAILENKNANKLTLRKLQKKLENINSQIAAEGSVSAKNYAQLHLDIQSTKNEKIDIEVSYYHDAAGWTPTYDLRANDLNDPLTISYKADIYQNTGEDWDEVEVSLSTADPTLDYTLPQLSPYYLSLNNYYQSVRKQNFRAISGHFTGRVVDSDGQSLIGANIIVPGTSLGTVSDLDGTFLLQVPRGYRYLEVSFAGYNTQSVVLNRRNLSVTLQEGYQLDEVVVTGLRGKASGAEIIEAEEMRQESIPLSLVQSQTTINYDISTPLELESNKQSQSILLRNESVPVIYKYKVFPKLNQDAFLTAEIKDWASLQVLHGTANIYIDKRYIGQTVIGEDQEIGDTYTLSLGQDKDVYVERELAKGFTKRKLIGSNIQETRKWNLKIINNKNQDIEMILQDQFPISKHSDIKVDLKEDADASVNKETGSLTWNLKIPSKTNFSLTFEYQVRFPKNRKVIVD